MNRFPQSSVIALVCLILWSTAMPGPRDPVDPLTAELLVDLVRVAAEYDLYSARCRGDLSGRRTDNLKKAMIRKYGLTPTQVQDDYFPERSHQAARRNIEKDFVQQIAQLGGCREAKKAGYLDDLRDRNLELLDKLNRLP